MSEPWRRLPALSLKQIQYFVTLSQLRSFTETANRLAISQPAISKTLKELEDLLEARLFERSRQGVELTPAGTRFMRYAGPSVQALREQTQMPLCFTIDLAPQDATEACRLLAQATGITPEVLPTGLRLRCPRLAAIAHNGAESFRHARSTAALATVFFIATLALAYLGNSRPAGAGSVLEGPGASIPAVMAPASEAAVPVAPVEAASGAAQIPSK